MHYGRETPLLDELLLVDCHGEMIIPPKFGGRLFWSSVRRGLAALLALLSLLCGFAPAGRGVRLALALFAVLPAVEVL